MSSEIIDSYSASLQGDQEAFAAIIRRYQNMISAITFSMTGNLQQGEDLARKHSSPHGRNLVSCMIRPNSRRGFAELHGI